MQYVCKFKKLQFSVQSCRSRYAQIYTSFRCFVDNLEILNQDFFRGESLTRARFFLGVSYVWGSMQVGGGVGAMLQYQVRIGSQCIQLAIIIASFFW